MTRRIGCSCGCRRTPYFADPDCKVNSTPGERYRKKVAEAKRRRREL